MSSEDIKAAIMTLDETKLHAEEVEVDPLISSKLLILLMIKYLQTLLNYIPTAEEVEQLNNYTDDRAKLGKAEQYFYTVKVRLNNVVGCPSVCFSKYFYF